MSSSENKLPGRQSKCRRFFQAKRMDYSLQILKGHQKRSVKMAPEAVVFRYSGPTLSMDFSVCGCCGWRAMEDLLYATGSQFTQVNSGRVGEGDSSEGPPAGGSASV